MSELFYQLGIDLKLLAAQGVNFLVVLVVLMTFVYRPLIKLIKERQSIIRKGLDDARLAEEKLANAESEKAAVLTLAHKEERKIIESAEEKALVREKEIVAAAAGKAFVEVEKIKNQASVQIAEREAEAEKAVKEKAASLIVRGMEKLLREEVDARKNEELIKKLTS